MAARTIKTFSVGEDVVNRYGPRRLGSVIHPTEDLLKQYHSERCVPVRWSGGRESWIEDRHLMRRGERRW